MTIALKRMPCRHCGLVTATIRVLSIQPIHDEHVQQLCIPCLKDALYDLAVTSPELIVNNSGDELECHV